MNNLPQKNGSLFHFSFLLFLVATLLDAAPTGEIIFVDQRTRSTIWSANVDGTNARQLFDQSFEKIYSISVQENGTYIVVVAEDLMEDPLKVNIYLFDLREPRTVAKNLTQSRFRAINNADISSRGDVAFSEFSGLYVIKNRELEKHNPEVEQLLNQKVDAVSWAPNGKQIVFRTGFDDLFFLNVVTKEVFQIADKARHPTFSPSGKQIAFSSLIEQNADLWTAGVAVAPPHANAGVKMLSVRKDYSYNYPTWSPDGKYIAYVSHTNLEVQNIEQFQALGNFAVSATGGDPEPILQAIKGTVWLFEWANKTYPVEPADSLVTTWGKLKERKTSKSGN